MQASENAPGVPERCGATIDPQTAQRKIERYFELCELSMDLALEGIKHRHPHADRAELLRLFGERLNLFRNDKWRRNG